MFLGSGGVVAAVAAVWSVIWAVLGTVGRPWRAWAASAIAFASVMVCAPLVTAQALWLRIYAHALRVLDLSERQEVLDAGSVVEVGLLAAACGLVLFTLSLAWGRRRRPQGGDLGLPDAVAGSLMVCCTAFSTSALLAFHVVLLSGGARAVAPSSMQVAALILMLGMASGWAGLIGAAGWGAWRAASGLVAARRAAAMA